MKFLAKVLTLVIAMVFVASCSGGVNYHASQYDMNSYSERNVSALPPADRYIVVFKDTVTNVADATRQVTAPIGVAPERTFTYAIKGFSATIPANAIPGIEKNPLVDYVEPDIVLYAAPKPDNPGGGKGGGKGGGGGGGSSELQWGVDRIDADKNSGPKGAGVNVVVFDTGIDTDHPDLAANYKGGYDFVNNDNSPEDDNGHGTHVSGIIAADDNGTGVIGVAPDAGIVAVKVLNAGGSGEISDIIAGIDWAIANKSAYDIEVANFSLGGYGESDAFHTAIMNLYNAGVTIAAAAGNDKWWAEYFIPASYPEVLCVSALAPGDKFASFSNYGYVVDLIAPGQDIKSTWVGGGYVTISGTSMAAPHVAGSAALWLDSHIGSPSDVMNALITAGEAPKRGKWPGDPDGVAEPLVDAENL